MPLLSVRKYMFESKASMSVSMNFFLSFTLFLFRSYYFLHTCILLVPAFLASSFLLLPTILGRKYHSSVYFTNIFYGHRFLHSVVSINLNLLSNYVLQSSNVTFFSDHKTFILWQIWNVWEANFEKVTCPPKLICFADGSTTDRMVGTYS